MRNLYVYTCDQNGIKKRVIEDVKVSKTHGIVASRKSFSYALNHCQVERYSINELDTYRLTQFYNKISPVVYATLNENSVDLNELVKQFDSQIDKEIGSLKNEIAKLELIKDTNHTELKRILEMCRTK
jgi:gas vesicle protein